MAGKEPSSRNVFSEQLIVAGAKAASLGSVLKSARREEHMYNTTVGRDKNKLFL